MCILKMKSDIEFRTECFRRLKPKFDQEFRSCGSVGIFQSDVLFRKKPGQTLIFTYHAKPEKNNNCNGDEENENSDFN